MKTKKLREDETINEASLSSERKRWNPSNVMFGLLLVVFGALFLLHNIGLITLSLDRIWQLWPLLIIAAGLSLVTTRGFIAAGLVGILIVASLGLAVLVPLGVLSPGDDRSVTTRTTEISREDNTTKDATVSITSGAGRITVSSDTIGQLVKASLKSNMTSLKQTSRTENGAQSVELIVGDSGGNWRGGNLQNDLDVTLSESTPLQLILNTGAATLDADLSDTDLRKLTLKTGASKSSVRLGNVSDTTDVSIEAGMSSVSIFVPKSSGLRLDVDSPMSGLSIPNLNKISDTTYESENFRSSTKKITIKSRTGMASLKIEYY